MEISDDILVCLWRGGIQEAIDLLCEKYCRFIYGIINDVFSKNKIHYDYRDMFQDCFIIFMDCISKYDEYGGCFYYFVKTAVERKVIDKIRYLIRTSKVLSLDNEFYDESRENRIDCVCDNSTFNDYADTKLFMDLNNKISELTIKIIELKMAGFNYGEIADLLKMSKQSVYRRMGAARGIVAEIIK